MITGGIPALGDLNVWGPLALAGGLSAAVGVAIGLVDAKLRRAPKPALDAAPTPGPESAAAEPGEAPERRAA